MTETKNSPWTKTTCAYCGVGCGIEARVETSDRIAVRGDQSHPANYGRLCSKGLALGETVVPDGRLLSPSIKGEATSWDNALTTVANTLTDAINQHGPDSVAFYVSGQLLTEDYYAANKLMKGFIGSANIDTNSRLCMSSSVAGHTRAFGSDTVPGCYEDIVLADLVVLVGSNLAWCHPVIYQRLKAAKLQRPEMKVVVVDPRRTDTCDIADLHLALQPGMDVALFNGLLGHLVKQECIDADYIERHTEGFLHAVVTAVEDTGGLPSLARALGLHPQDLADFYSWFAQTEKTVTVYSQGVNQSSQGTDKVNSIINCHLATGRIGKPGCGPFSVTGQPNAMGGREVGGLANMLAAHMDFSQPANLARVRRFWGTENLAEKPGLKAVDLFDAVAEGKIKVLWIMATNPVVSMPDAGKIKRALEQCPTVIVSDCIADTDTTRCADILLPAAGWAEKSGTVTNSERRISRQRALMPLSGEARPDWWIISEVAKRMGFVEAFDYPSEHAIFVEYARLTGLDNHGSRDLDISGLAEISRQDYDALTPQQWPVASPGDISTAAELPPARRFFADGRFFTVSGKAQFIATPWHAPADVLTDKFPLVLNTGRIRDQWHTMTRSSLASRLNAHLPEPFISVHPRDAERYDLEPNGLAEVTSAYGMARLRVQVTQDVQPGQLFMPMHWSEVQSNHATVGKLVSPDVDPVSGQPELKYTSVAIAPWHYASKALVVVRSELFSQLDNWLNSTDSAQYYWAKQPITGGYACYLASQQTPDTLRAELDALRPQGVHFELLNFSNPNSGEHRTAVGKAEQLLYASIVASSQADQDYQWLTALLGEKLNSTTKQAIIKGQAVGTLGGRTVCACHKVGHKQICQAIHEGNLKSAVEIGAATSAGTGCGSCVPELNRILAEEKPVKIAC